MQFLTDISLLELEISVASFYDSYHLLSVYQVCVISTGVN